MRSHHWSGDLITPLLKGKSSRKILQILTRQIIKQKVLVLKKFLQDVKTTGLNAYRTDIAHIDFKSRTIHPGVYNYSNFRYRHDGNGVDMDKEQADLATNQIYYNALVDRINGKFSTLQNVIKGGR